MGDIDLETVTFYDSNAASFAAQTGEIDMSPLYERFLKYVPLKGRILDAGCGVGRDVHAFVKRGYQVEGFDASSAMVRLARERVGDMAQIHHMRFDEARWQNEFDGVWACASLLHVPASDFPDVAFRLVKALRPRGAWYMSFKLGTIERIAGGRRFTDHTEDTLRAMLTKLSITTVDTWVSEDARPDRKSEQWINAVVLRR